MGTTLYRPVGLYELEKIAALQFMGFPPRLPEQPIFYPVLSFAYAAQIASRWNTVDSHSGYCGFVTAFELGEHYISRFPCGRVGGPEHQEYWVPAEELEQLNAQLLGPICILAAFYGPNYTGLRPQLSGKQPEEQRRELMKLF